MTEQSRLAERVTIDGSITTEDGQLVHFKLCVALGTNSDYGRERLSGFVLYLLETNEEWERREIDVPLDRLRDPESYQQWKLEQFYGEAMRKLHEVVSDQ